MEFPAYPNFSPLNQSGREQVWGKFNYKAAPIDGNPENIEIDRDWVKQNISMVHIPQLKGIPGAPRSCKVAFHSRAADQLIEVFNMWESEGLINRILTWNGSFCPRFIRRSKTVLSNHAFANAFDINAQWNALGTPGAKPGEKGCVWELVPAATTCGFFWGGFFNSRKDNMHFQADMDLEMNPLCLS